MKSKSVAAPRHQGYVATVDDGLKFRSWKSIPNTTYQVMSKNMWCNDLLIEIDIDIYTLPVPPSHAFAGRHFQPTLLPGERALLHLTVTGHGWAATSQSCGESLGGCEG